MFSTVALLATMLEITPARAAPSSGPASRQVDELIAQLADPNPTVREKARLITLNLTGNAYRAVEAALSQPGLSPAAQQVLKMAEPRLKERARLEDQQLKAFAWKWESPIEEWKRVGHKDPRWNLWVEDGIRAFSGSTAAEQRRALQNFDKAVNAGCDDPLVLYMRARSGDSGGAGTVRQDPVESYHAAAKAMLGSNYNAAWKMIALSQYFQKCKELPADISLETLIRLTIEASKDPKLPRSEIWSALYGTSPKLCAKYGWDEDFKRLNPAFEQAFANQWYAPYFKGVFYVYWAWDARGSGVASTVTPQGWKLFEERIDIARKALEEAWKLDPTQNVIYEQMITVCMAKSDKERLEQWFRRGIEANPDDYQLCQNKMYALTPRWLGSHEEMLAFGKECAATLNYYGSIAHMIVNAHDQIARESPDADQYMLQPQVWNDIHKPLEDRLLLYPTVHNRSRYVQWAARCGHWEVIPPQCKILGDHPDPAVFPDRSAYHAIRQKADEFAAAHGGGSP